MISPSREYFDALLTAHQGRVVYSTFGRQSSFDFSDLLTRFERSGDGGLRIAENNSAEMFTIASQNIALTMSELPSSREYVLHLLAQFPSNVEDNFYASFEGGDARDSVRFGNSYISISDDASTLQCDTKPERLYTFVAGGGFVSLYVNGELQKRKRRSTTQLFNTFVLRLVGAQSADLGAVIRGIEIWSLDTPFQGFSTRAHELVLQRLRELIEARDAEGIHEWVTSFDDIDFTYLEERILTLLEEKLRGPGVKEWVYDDILERVAPERERKWRQVFAAKMPSPVITVENLCVTFHRFPNKQLSIGRVLGLTKGETFDVLRRISFRVYPGDILGIIGANGAGKSTLLKAIAGLLPIADGKITLTGHHLLLSPGLGMRNELSGRDNIYLAGCFMGLTLKQVDRMYDDIVDFSELREFIDQPFKFYSDGMKSRLIFSIATSVAPTVLMLDELLNAGDIKFQVKAAQRLDELISRAKVVIVVTHSIRFVADKCSKALLLSRGKQVYYGDPSAAIAHYLDELHMPQSLSKEALPEENFAAG